MTGFFLFHLSPPFSSVPTMLSNLRARMGAAVHRCGSPALNSAGAAEKEAGGSLTPGETKKPDMSLKDTQNRDR